MFFRKKKESFFDSFANILPDYSFHRTDGDFQTRLSPVPAEECKKKQDVFQAVKKDYLTNLQRTSFAKSDIWQTYIVPRYKDLFDAFSANDDKKASDYMENMFINGATGGFATYSYEIDEALKTNDTLNKNLAKFYMDTLVNFAEYLGAIPIENQEQGYFGASLLENPDSLLDLIENKLKLKIVFPKYKKGLMAVKTSRGFFTNRDIVYLYLALKIKDIFSDNSNPKICEIGGGIGLLAYYCDLIGIKNVTLVDIVSTSIFSGYFLRENLAHREFSSGSFQNSEAIKFLLPEDFMALNDTYFDMVINCDSFLEINAEVVRDYLFQTKKITDKFYSVNQEANRQMWNLQDKQNVVSELIAACNTGQGKCFKRLSRNLFWLRRGYVEEFYEIV